MSYIFLLFFLVSITALIIGLVKPSIFSRFLKEKATRKNIAIIFSIAGIVSFFLIGITTDTSGVKTVQENQPIQQSASRQETDQQQGNERVQNQQEVASTKEDIQETETPQEDTTPQETTPAVASFGNGTHIVGTDIVAGTYRSQGTRTCYWARLSGFGGELDDVLANGNSAPEIVTISASDAAFETSGCGQWVAVESTYPATPATSFFNGTYEIGKHIVAGTYRASGNPDDLCYWARLSNFSHSGISGVITNGNSPTVIQISANDKGFTTFGCDNWTKI